MMIKVIEKTDVGRAALIEQHKESIKMGFQKKAMMKMLGIKQEVTSQEPYTFEVAIKNDKLSSLVNPAHIIREIEDFMITQAAERDRDYTVVIE